jgi:hypothetical protein
LSRSFCYARAAPGLEGALEQRSDAEGDQKELIEADGGKTAALEKNGLKTV